MFELRDVSKLEILVQVSQTRESWRSPKSELLKMGSNDLVILSQIKFLIFAEFSFQIFTDFPKFD